MSDKPVAALLSSVAFLLMGPVVLAQEQEPVRLAPVAVSQFYAGRDEAPAWSEDQRFDGLIQAIERLSDHGLDPGHYHLQALRARKAAPERRERLATDAWFAAAAHMVHGKLDPLTYETDWTAARRDRNLANDLAAALAAGTVENSLELLAPNSPEYAALMVELSDLRRQQEDPIVVIPDGPALKLGMTAARVYALQKRLVQLGLMQADANTGIFDQQTEQAVKEFQETGDLDADGIVGPATTARLNRGIQSKIDQIMVNLERWRWLPEDLGRRHLRANIAGFSVAAYNEGLRERTHLIIVGKQFRRTPVFSDEIEYIVLNPWWETPKSIARKDKLPLFQRDPGVVEKLGFQVIDSAGRIVPPASIEWASLQPATFPYKIRQAPGPLNALGKLKIMFPNKHSVYLHDTPSRGLFAERQRAFSSGCLRTQDPEDLATWLLEETPGWDKARLDEMIATGKTTRVNLKSPVPIHILYFTVVIDSYGTLRYLDDIYLRDENVLRGLKEAAS